MGNSRCGAAERFRRRRCCRLRPYDSPSSPITPTPSSPPPRVCAAPPRYWEPRRQTQGRAYERWRPHHQSSGSSRAPSPDSAAGPDVYIVDAARLQLGATEVIVIVGVAAVHDHVVTVKKGDKGFQRRIRLLPPVPLSRRRAVFQLLGKVFERPCADRPLLYEHIHSFGLEIVNDALVPARRPIMPNSM